MLLRWWYHTAFANGAPHPLTPSPSGEGEFFLFKLRLDDEGASPPSIPIGREGFVLKLRLDDEGALPPRPPVALESAWRSRFDLVGERGFEHGD